MVGDRLPGPCDAWWMSEGAGVRARIELIVAEYLGARIAASAVRLAAINWAHHDPEELKVEDLPAMRRGLEPMLRTFLGAEVTAVVLRRMDREVGA
jgi:hypothetical protein